MKRLPRHSTAFCSEEGWFATGMAASFIDPMFASTCMTIAALNLLIESLIEADMAGEDELLKARTEHFNVFFQVKLMRYLNWITFYEFGLIVFHYFFVKKGFKFF